MDIGSLKYFVTGLEEQSHDIKYQFYFDANDVIDILMGVNTFYDLENKFNRKKFDNPATLIHCLAFGKYLKSSIKLLPTHQAELAAYIKSKIPNSMKDNKLRDFMDKDMNFFVKLKKIIDSKVDIINDEIIQNWIDNESIEIFKALVLSYKDNIKSRFDELFKENIFSVEDYEAEDIIIHDDFLYDELSRIFRKFRPYKEYDGNNFRDVISLMYLSRAVQEFNEDNSKPLPVYFDSNCYLSEIPEEILERYFRVKIRNSTNYPEDSYSLRDHDFFKIFVLIDVNNSVAKEENLNYQRIIGYYNLFKELEFTLKENASKNKIPKVKEWFENLTDDLTDESLKYFELDLCRVLNKSIFNEQLIIVNDILNNFNQKALDENSGESINEFERGSARYLMNKIESITEDSFRTRNEIDRRLRRVFSLLNRFEKDGLEFDIFNCFSLFRFFIPNENQRTLKFLFSNDGYFSENKEKAGLSKKTLLILYLKTVYYRKDKTYKPHELLTNNELFVLYCSFWILSLHDKLLDFNSETKYLTNLHHSLLMLIGACIDRTLAELNLEEEKKSTYKALYRRIIEVLEEKIDVTNISKAENISQIKIVLAYLYFHLWQQEGNSVIIKRPTLSISGIEDDDYYNGVAANYKAVLYAKEAYEFYKNDTSKFDKYYLYSLNIYVYYSIAVAPDNEFRKITSIVNDLIQLRKSKNWHFRYDDTLAANYHRFSMLMQDTDKKLYYIEEAISILDDAVKANKFIEGKDINELDSYLKLLINIKGQLELPQSPEINEEVP